MSTLAVAAALQNKDKDIELLYVGSHKPQDRELVEAAGLQFRAISTGKLRRYFSLQNLVDSINFLKGIGEAQNILQEFKPNVVFAKGGYVALPVVMAAKRLRIPVVIHESDSRLGLTNRLAVASAKWVAVSFPVANYIKTQPKLVKYKNKFVYTGLPIAKGIVEAPKKKFFVNNRPIVLVAGGSQGALTISKVLWQTLPELLAKYNVIHQAGKSNYSQAQDVKKGLPGSLGRNYMVMGFEVDGYRKAMKAADLIVARAGSSIFEFQALGKPVILIPLPGSANNHQHHNAMFLSSRNAAITIDQKDLSPDTLRAAIEQVIEDKTFQAKLSDNILELGRMNRSADERLADLIIKTAK